MLRGAFRMSSLFVFYLDGLDYCNPSYIYEILKGVTQSYRDKESLITFHTMGGKEKIMEKNEAVSIQGKKGRNLN